MVGRLIARLYEYVGFLVLGMDMIVKSRSELRSETVSWIREGA